MQTFGRLRLDVENCVRELVDFGVARARRRRRRRATSAARPDATSALGELLDTFLERRATVSTEDQSPSVQRFREMIGRDEKMLVVFEWIRTAAKSDISVLILGPTGSGKEVVARMIHELSRAQRARSSRRSTARRCPTRCSSRRSSATRRARSPARTIASPGRLELANDGTLFLDEIGDMSLDRAGQAAARARGAALRAARRQQVDLGRLPPDLGDQPAARAVRPRQPVPRRPLLPRQRVRDPAAVAARAAGRHPGARAALPRALLRGAAACRSTARRSRSEALDLLLRLPLARQHPRARKHGVARGAVGAGPRRSAPPTSSSCTRTTPAPQSTGDRLPSLADAERAHIVRVLEAVELEQEGSGARARHQPRHALPEDRRVSARTRSARRRRGRDARRDSRAP